MRKRIIGSSPPEGAGEHEWLDLATVAEVEVTSEDPSFPIENALLRTDLDGWRASEPGPQTIRLLFPHPQPIHLIDLEFHEPNVERTQEFQLSWTSGSGQRPQEILRQQWNFSPGGATSQTEQVRVDLPSVAVLELVVTPEISGGEARATLARMRLA